MARADTPILVIGLGRFGGAVARTLVELGREVLAMDQSPELVQKFAGTLTHVVEGDSTDLQTLAQLGAGEFDRAVVAIGTDIEASILTTAALVDAGVKEIWAKAVTRAHGKILSRVGAHHVIYPEHEMGERIAHVVTGRMIDFIQLDANFTLVETPAPRALVGKTLAESEVRRRYKITVVSIKPVGRAFTYATPDTPVGEGDILVIAGETAVVEAFAELD